MNDEKQWWFRLGLLTELVEQTPGKPGRTALMKLAYLLQTIKDVPLGYSFGLHTYGPFDSDILNDLAQAESLDAVKSQLISFPGGSGYGYEFRVGPGRDLVRRKVGDELANYQEAIRWAVDEFGKYSAADLELITTIIYADREAARQQKTLGFQELTRMVKEIKPRFTDQYIAEHIHKLAAKELLKASRQE